MNSIFLEKYTKLHLEDLEEYSAEAHRRFQDECSSFLSTIKTTDREVYTEVMTMTANKKSQLLVTLYNMHEAAILGISNDEYRSRKLEELKEIDSDLADTFIALSNGSDDIKLTDEQLSELREELSDIDPDNIIEEGAIKNIGSISYAWFIKTLKDLKTVPKQVSDNPEDIPTNAKWNKIFRVLLWMVSIGSVGAAVFGGLGVIASVFTILILVGSVILLYNETNIAGHLVETIKLIGFAIMTFIKDRKDISFNKQFEAIYALENSQLVACIPACGVDSSKIRSKHERNRIIRLYTFRRRSKDTADMSTHRRISGDCILACSLKYLISMIAEMYGALRECLRNTGGGNIDLSIDNVVDLTRIDMSASCEPIRDELIALTNKFRDFLNLAYKDNQSMRKQWEKALNRQIRNVMNGQHSKPIAIAPSVSSNSVVFEI